MQPEFEPLDPSSNGVYRVGGGLPALPGLIRLDGRSLATKAALLDALGQALDFPDYYGANWDALEECLQDLSWWQGPVRVLIEHAGCVPRHDLETLVAIWGEAAGLWARAGRPFLLLLQGVEGLIRLPKIG